MHGYVRFPPLTRQLALARSFLKAAISSNQLGLDS